jgi:hypothetical protein
MLGRLEVQVLYPSLWKRWVTEAQEPSRDALGLPLLLNHLTQPSEPPYAAPQVPWCGSGERATALPMPIARQGTLRPSGNIARLHVGCDSGIMSELRRFNRRQEPVVNRRGCGYLEPLLLRGRITPRTRLFSDLLRNLRAEFFGPQPSRTIRIELDISVQILQKRRVILFV